MESLNVLEAKQMLEILIDNNIKRAAMLWGPPGIGKSDIIKQIAEERHMGFIDIRLLMYNPVDLRGIPFPNEDHTKANWLSPDTLPNVTRDGERGILILDELPAAPLSVQTAAYQLVLDRKIEGYTLPDGWFVFAAGNRKEDNAGVNGMPTPLANRMIHVEIKPEFEIWKNWAYQHNINQDIISFLNYRTDLFYIFDPRSKSPSFPTARSWEFASEAMSKSHLSMDHKLLYSIISGAVGDGAAAELSVFIKIESKLPNIDAIINGNYRESDVPKSPDVIYMLIGKLINVIRDNIKSYTAYNDIPVKNITTINNILSYMIDELQADFAVLGIRDALKLNKEIIVNILLKNKASAWIRFLNQHEFFFN